MTMTQFVVIRHGETHWNTQGRMQGHLDSPLTPSGERQVARVARELRGETFHHFAASDLGRTIATARAMSEDVPLPIALDPSLRERHLGAFEGLTLEEARGVYPEDARRFSERDPEHRVPGGESIRDVSERVVACFEALARTHAGGHVLVITHGGVLDVLCRHARGLELSRSRDFGLPNAAINRLEHEAGTWRVLQWAAVEHLDEQLAADDAGDARR